MLRKNVVTIIIFLFFCLSQAQVFLPADVKRSLLTEVSGEIAKDYVYTISRYDRIQASEGYHRAAEWIMNKLKSYGIDNAHIEKYVSNGEQKYYTWTPPMGWRIDHGELWLVSPVKKRLAYYEEMPTSIVKGSRSANLTAEVIDAGDGLDSKFYEGKNVGGKILLATGYTGDVNREGVIKRGAAGIITYFPYDERIEYPELIRYTAMWPRKFENPMSGFGFNVTKKDGLMLKNYLEQGQQVVVKVDIEADNYESHVEPLTCVIRGSTYPEKEIIIMGHLCHYKPGANDNASGSAVMMEVARAFKKLIDKNVIHQPKRTVRFLWIPEYNGVVPYLHAHPEINEKGIIGINLDMVGNDVAKTNSYFYFTKTPHSLPSFINDLTEFFIREIANAEIYSLRGTRYKFNYRIFNYSGGSDHYIFCDGAIGVPSLMFGHPDPFHHTVQDVPDNVDASELRRVAYLTALITQFAANAEKEEAIGLADLVYSKAAGRLAEELMEIKVNLAGANTAKSLANAYKESEIRLTYARKREEKCIRSVQELSGDIQVIKYTGGLIKNLNDFFEDCKKQMEEKYEYTLNLKRLEKTNPDIDPLENEAKNIIPVRTEIFKCPLSRDYLGEKLGQDVEINLNEYVQYEVANFMDGTRNLKEIRDAVSAEYSPQNLKDIMDFVEILKNAELVEY